MAKYWNNKIAIWSHWSDEGEAELHRQEDVRNKLNEELSNIVNAGADVINKF